MLVLSRKCGEKVMIVVPPSDKEVVIEVTLVELRPDRARIGFEAPRSVSIHRQEIYDEMRSYKEQANGGNDAGQADAGKPRTDGRL